MRSRPVILFTALSVLTVGLFLLDLAVGAVRIPVGDVWELARLIIGQTRRNVRYGVNREERIMKYVKNVVVSTADEIIKAAGSNMKYKVGTMIEIPRAALTADEIAKEAEFFSFGTNDLTQMTFGFSRDDAPSRA